MALNFQQLRAGSAVNHLAVICKARPTPWPGSTCHDGWNCSGFRAGRDGCRTERVSNERGRMRQFFRSLDVTPFPPIDLVANEARPRSS